MSADQEEGFGVRPEVEPLGEFAEPIVRMAERLIEHALSGKGLGVPADALELIGTMMLRGARHAQFRAIEGAQAGCPPELATFLAEDDMEYQTASVLCDKLAGVLD